MGRQARLRLAVQQQHNSLAKQTKSREDFLDLRGLLFNGKSNV